MIVMPIANIRFQGKETVEIKRFKIGALFYFKGESVSYKFSLMWIFAFYRMIGAFAITKNSFSKRDLCDETGEKRNISLFLKKFIFFIPVLFKKRKRSPHNKAFLELLLWNNIFRTQLCIERSYLKVSFPNG